MQEDAQLPTTPPLPGLDLVTKINAALQTIATDFAGPDDPAGLAWAYATWADTGNMRLKRRNTANSAWVDLGPLLGAFAEQSGAANFATDVGAVNALSVPLAPAVSGFTQGMVIRAKAAQTNTGPTTLALNGLVALEVVGLSGAALQGGEIIAARIATFMYSANQNKWILLYCEDAPMQLAPSTKSLHAATRSQVPFLDQTRQNVTASRAPGTTYTNSTGKPIWVSAYFVSTAGSSLGYTFSVGSIAQAYFLIPGAVGIQVVLTVTGWVMPGESYAISLQSGTASSYTWHEVR